MSNVAVYGIYPSKNAAEYAIDALKSAGFRNSAVEKSIS